MANENGPSSVQSSGNIRKRPRSTLESSAYKTEESLKKDRDNIRNPILSVYIHIDYSSINTKRSCRFFEDHAAKTTFNEAF